MKNEEKSIVLLRITHLFRYFAVALRNLCRDKWPVTLRFNINYN